MQYQKTIEKYKEKPKFQKITNTASKLRKHKEPKDHIIYPETKISVYEFVSRNKENG